MFFSNDPKEFEPLEKEQLDDMLKVWEEEIFPNKNDEPLNSRARTGLAVDDRMLAAHNLVRVNPSGGGSVAA